MTYTNAPYKNPAGQGYIFESILSLTSYMHIYVFIVFNNLVTLIYLPHLPLNTRNAHYI